MTLTRRRFLQGLAAAGAAASAGISIAAPGAGDYRALVCLFLYGGLDCHDLLLPADAGNYASFARRRQDLLAAYGGSRERSALLPLAAGGAAGAAWALPPELASARQLYDRGELALVANVGPLLAPTDRRAFLDRAVPLPARLFSHNDQQATWQAGAPEGAQYGWGGLFADALLDQAGDAQAFATIATAQPGPFLTGTRAFPYQLSTDGAASIFLLDRVDDDGAPFHQRLRAHLRGANHGGAALLRRDIAARFADSLDTNERFNAAREYATPLATPFPEDSLGAQLRGVAETIALRDVLGVNRQVFFVGIGGFDTHSQQASTLPGLLAGIDAGVAAFSAAMAELAVSGRVTLFTASDFGRTLAVNGDGTDHGWGGHHLVVGGAVAGGRLYGTPPPPDPEHDQDADSGRLIPTLSVEQLAEPLGQWFGLDESALLNALPRLPRFDRGTLPLFG